MTLLFSVATVDQLERRIITRQVSSMALPIPDGGLDEEDASSQSHTPTKTSNHGKLQVFNDGLAAISDTEENDLDDFYRARRSSSPVRCVSEFDKVIDGDIVKRHRHVLASILPRDPKFFAVHVRSLRIEAELQPMRLILTRLMNHQTMNRKGIFNNPVDPVALKLPDYFDVIKQPMDLGLVKMKLHSIAYLSRREVADDIRLIMNNAMKYNPPNNAIHEAAKGLLAFFEDQLQAYAPGSREKNFESSNSSVLRDDITFDPSALQLSSTSTSHNQGTRNSVLGVLTGSIQFERKRAKRGSKVDVGHACLRCQGHTCTFCNQGCLPLEPTLIICNGAQCAGSKIRKGSIYFTTADGSLHYCQRCHTSVPAILPPTPNCETIRYKRDLLKRKNDEEIVEEWVNCSRCDASIHRVCALYDHCVHSFGHFYCPECIHESCTSIVSDHSLSNDLDNDLYTFVSGVEVPLKLSDVTGSIACELFSAESLPETDVSSFIERRVRECLPNDRYPNAGRTIHVRMISDCHRCFKVPEVVRSHFRMSSKGNGSNDSVAPPSSVSYKSMAIALFQKIDGLDVCIFCMYVHEYDGDKSRVSDEKMSQNKRVYIAYLDSVEHFRPRYCRTSVYHEMLVAYLASARKRGFESAHIWSCPPSRGNCFVFWNHPASQRTPNPERLEAWYHAALSRAVDCGVVTDIQSLYETSFKQQVEPKPSELRQEVVPCPPLLDGDFWMEEAVRVHNMNMLRLLKVKVDVPGSSTVTSSIEGFVERCPARQIATLLYESIISHPSALPFRRPVNASALKIHDYHRIIKKPMDLGTVYSRCMLGEYATLVDLVSDVELVFTNAKTYNPKGHVVYVKAEEVRAHFYFQLNNLTRRWVAPGDSCVSWETFSSLSLSLDLVFPDTSQQEVRSKRANSLTHLVFDDSLFEPATKLEKEENVLTMEMNSCLREPLALIGGGPGAVHHCMVGDDTWLLKKNQMGPKGCGLPKVCRRRKNHLGECNDEPPTKRRRQIWLGIEVGTAMRRMRTSFFSCSLIPKSLPTCDRAKANEAFENYTNDFGCSPSDQEQCASTIADARHSLLDFFQYRNLEFSTLRHAKYSTSVLLYHLHSKRLDSVAPTCTSCKTNIKDVRWHQMSKVIDLRLQKNTRKSRAVASSQLEELCGECYCSSTTPKDQFIPLQVTFGTTSSNSVRR